MGGRLRYAFISATSNTVVQRVPGALHGVFGNFPSGSIARIDDAHSFPQGVLDINAASSNTVARIGAPVTGLDIGLNSGLVIAVSSNAAVTVAYDTL